MLWVSTLTFHLCGLGHKPDFLWEGKWDLAGLIHIRKAHENRKLLEFWATVLQVSFFISIVSVAAGSTISCDFPFQTDLQLDLFYNCEYIVTYIWMGDAVFFADLQNFWPCLSLTCLVRFALVSAVNIGWSLDHWSYFHVQCNIYFLASLGFTLSAPLHLLHSRMELRCHAANWRIFIL